MLENATDERLKQVIENYIKETYDQKQRLEEIGEYLHIKFYLNDRKIIRGLLEEVKELYEEFPKGFLMYVGIIAIMQHVEHFQISAYESALLYARTLWISWKSPTNLIRPYGKPMRRMSAAASMRKG